MDDSRNSTYCPRSEHQPAALAKRWKRSYRRRQKPVKRRRRKSSESVESTTPYAKTYSVKWKSGEGAKRIDKPYIVRTPAQRSELRLVSSGFSAECFCATAPVSLLLCPHAAHLFQSSVFNQRHLLLSLFH